MKISQVIDVIYKSKPQYLIFLFSFVTSNTLFGVL